MTIEIVSFHFKTGDFSIMSTFTGGYGFNPSSIGKKFHQPLLFLESMTFPYSMVYRCYIPYFSYSYIFIIGKDDIYELPHGFSWHICSIFQQPPCHSSRPFCGSGTGRPPPRGLCTAGLPDLATCLKFGADSELENHHL